MGTRPQVIKLASLTAALADRRIDFEIVHTGQHYDFEMDRIFFDELGLPEPTANLGVGSGSHARQTAEILLRLEKYYQSNRPEMVVVPGDTNSALGGALVAVKMGIPVGHVEAGLRSHQQFMPEEINRVAIDHTAQLLFAPTKAAEANLRVEGLVSRTRLTGDVMADNIVMFRNMIDDADTGLGSSPRSYVYVTLHRSENVDRPERLSAILKAIFSIPHSLGLEVVFPVHPRTRSRLAELGTEVSAERQGLHLLEPVGYLESLKLAKDAFAVVTDSGGLQKEAFILGTPAITLRESTEWVETVDAGWNNLVGLNVRALNNALRRIQKMRPPRIDPLHFYGDGKAAMRISRLISRHLALSSTRRAQIR